VAASSEKFRKKASMPFLEKEARSAWAVQSWGSETTIAMRMSERIGGRVYHRCLKQGPALDKSVPKASKFIILASLSCCR
jgi:hypothetical protein